MTKIEILTNDTTQSNTSGYWKNTVEHTKSVIEETWRNESILEELVDMVISINWSSDTESTECEDSDSTLSPLYTCPICINLKIDLKSNYRNILFYFQVNKN